MKAAASAHSHPHVHTHSHSHAEGECAAPCSGFVSPASGPALRSTRQREAVRASLEAAGRPMAPQELLAAAQSSVPGLGIATVYRHLKSLQADALVRAVELPGQAARYELVRHAHQHHFHCEVCDRVYPVLACPGSMERLAPAGFTVERHDITLHGRCADCVQSGAQAGAKVSA
jgi:Fur family transcriptional regulator, ferric uptake regulator